jgi:hypothetical protein
MGISICDVCHHGLCRHVANLGNVSSMFPAWALSEYCDAWIGYIDMLPSWTMSHRCCLLGHYRNTLMPAWAVSTYLPTWAMSHRHCLFGHCRNTSMPAWAMSTCCHHGLCLLDVSCLGTIRHFDACLGYIDMFPSWAMSHQCFLLGNYRNTAMPE